MRKISDFLSKPLISISNATFEGTIIGFLCEKKLKAVEFLVVLVENDVLDEKKYVALKSVKNATEDTVTVLNNLCIKSADSIDLGAYVDNPINSAVYSAEGELIGKLTDVLFGDTTKMISQIAVGETMLPVAKIASTTKDIIVLSDGKPKRKPTPKKVKKSVDVPVELFDNVPPVVAEKKSNKESVGADKQAMAAAQPEPFKTAATVFEGIIDDELSNKEISAENKEIADVRDLADDAVLLDNASATVENNIDDNLSKSTEGVEPIESTNTVDVVFYESDESSAETTAKNEDNGTMRDNPTEAVDTVTKITAVPIGEVTPRRVYDKLPKKLISDFRFLLGRVVTDNIYNHRRELIIRRQQLVTAEVVQCAHKNNKLIELTLNSKL